MKQRQIGNREEEMGRKKKASVAKAGEVGKGKEDHKARNYSEIT